MDNYTRFEEGSLSFNKAIGKIMHQTYWAIITCLTETHMVIGFVSKDKPLVAIDKVLKALNDLKIDKTAYHKIEPVKDEVEIFFHWTNSKIKFINQAVHEENIPDLTRGGITGHTMSLHTT